MKLANTAFYEACQAHKYGKFMEHWSRRSTKPHKARQAREHVKHVSTPNTRVRQARQLAASIVLKLNIQTLVPS